MQDPYDDDDGYDDDQYDYDNNDQYDPYKFYFTFNVDQTPLSDWISKMINSIINNKDYDIDKTTMFPVNSWNPNTANDKKFQYLGSNYQGSPIWKSKYFIKNDIDIMYKHHIQSHSVHFIQQPTYYRGMYDILN